MTCTDVRRMNAKAATHAKPTSGRIFRGVLLTVLLVLVAVLVSLYLHHANVEQQIEIQQDYRDDMIAELERSEGTYDAQSIVLYNTSRAKAEDLAEKLGASLRMTKDGKFATLTLPEGTTILDVHRDEANLAYLEQMSADYQVRISELIEGEEDEEGSDERLPMRPTYNVSDTDYEMQTYLDYMNMQNVWANYTGAGVTIAVIDTGIDTDHPEFAGRISEYSYNATEDKIVKDYVLDNGEYDWSLVEDEQGHGTAVTGVIAAAIDGAGTVGVAPNVTIITIKAECDENGSFKRTSDLVFGLYYAIERDVSVVNMSFGGYHPDNPYAEATQLAYDSDVICVAAAGNNATASLCWPAADPLVIGVGALADGSWELAEYSNYGENVNVVAPGTTYTTSMGGGYDSMDGTSLACPAVTGMIALYMQRERYATFDHLTEELYASSYDLGDLGCDWYYGYGAVDANAFLVEERGTVTYDMLTDEVEDLEGTFVRGIALQELPEPERLYAEFDGWYYDEHCTQRVEYYTDAFYGDITLYASWVNEDDGIPYTYVILEDGTVEIRSYTGHRRYITIPEKIDGRVVSSIGDFAFAGETNLREVGLPSGLTHIGLSAFEGCSNLVSIYIPENVTEIEESAFAECVRLSTVAFTGQSKLLTVGDGAFESCGKLRTIELPASLQSIKGTAFVDTSALTSIHVQSDNHYFKSEDGVLFDISGETLIAYPAAHGTTYAIPDGTKTVGAYAFYGAKVIFLELGNIESIEKQAFALSSVISVHIPDSVTYMGDGAFMKSAIKELTIGSGLAEIAGGAFAYCTSLRSVYIPAGIIQIKTSILGGAFQSSGLRELTFAENSQLYFIANGAFALCGLTEVEIPASVVYLGTASDGTHEPDFYSSCGPKGAFDTNAHLSKVTFAEGSQLTVIGDRAFAYCALTEIDLPEGLEMIGAGAFYTNYFDTVMLPASLIQLNEAVFGHKVTPDTMPTLSAIFVADGNVVYHDVDGVVYNHANTEVHAFPAGRGGEYTVLDTVLNVMPYSFAGTAYLEKVTLPEGLIEIGNYAFCYSGSYTYDLPSTLVYIKNGGFYSNFRLNSITLPEGLEQIAEYAFYGCSVLPTIHIPDSVLQIGRYAFAQDWSLYSVTFNDTAKLPRISFGAFSHCGIYSFRVPANVSTMAQKAFEGCPYLTEMTFAENSKLESISAYMFDGCSNLQTITFEQGSALTSVQAHGLEGMDNLTQINWSDAKVTNIDNFAFRFCESLSYLTLPETVTNVGRYAFYGCKSLSELTLPANMEHIGMFAFLGTGDLNLYFAADTMPAYLDEDWDHGIRGYYVGVTNVQTQGDYKYATLTSGDVSIIEYLGSNTELDLSVLDFGAPITGIGGSAFEDMGITHITLPDTLTNIQAEAFAYNPFEEITIPAGVTFIGREAFTYTEIASLTFAEGSQIKTIEQYAFERTRNLTEVTLPASLTTMGRGVFQESGLTSVTFEEGIALERIPENAFAESKLTSIAFPDSVNYVDHNAFREISTLQSVTFGNAESISLQSNSFYHTGLTSLHIPANVTYIGEYSFVALANLTEITVDENNPYYKSEDGLLLSKDGRKLIVVPAGRTGSLTVPASVEMLGFGAFEETKLSEVKFNPDANILTIGYRAFFKANNLTSIDIPKSVISIDYYAFAYCENLQTVNFAEDNQLKGIYEGAFLGDINLENITIPDTIVEISDFAFYGCSKIDRIPISENGIVKGIYSYAFAYTGISGEFSTPETLIDIGDYAFLGTKITQLTVPDTNQWDLIIGIGAFEDCNKLREITLPFIGASFEDPDITWLGYIFGAGGYEANATYVPTSLKTVTITEGITLIGTGAFYHLTELERLNIPHSICTLYPESFTQTKARYELTNEITALERSYYYNNEYFDEFPAASQGHFGSGLEGDLRLADGMKVIGSNAFAECSSLQCISIPDSITAIEHRAFDRCSSLTRVYITDVAKWCAISMNTDSASSPLDYASLYLNGKIVTDLVIPEGVTQINPRVFRDCNDIRSVTLPAGLTEIGEDAFRNCSIDIVYNNSDLQLKIGSENHGVIAGSAKLIVDKNGNKTYRASEGDFEYVETKDGFQFERKDGKYTLVAYIGGEDTVILPENMNGEPYEIYRMKGVRNLIIPEGVTSIDYSAFGGCTSLESVVMPDSVTSIGQAAFEGCINLTSITFSQRLEKIGIGAFSSCRSLATVTIPNSVTNINSSAFSWCENLENITIPDHVSRIDSKAFAFCDRLTHVTIGSGLRVIGEGAFSECNIESFTVSEQNKYFSTSDGLLCSKDGTQIYYVPKEVVSIDIPNGVTVIDDYMFSDCLYLESVTIPDSVKEIGYAAFENCVSLKSVMIPDSVTTIQASAFRGCTSLESVKLPKNLDQISYAAFQDCVNLKDIMIPNNVTIISSCAFLNCSNLTYIEIPEGVCEIEMLAFAKTGLKSVSIPASVILLEGSAFAECLNLTSVNITNLTKWCKWSFSAHSNPLNNSDLYLNGELVTELVIPDGVTAIGNGAFYGCTSITSVIIPDSVTYIGESAFGSCGSLSRVVLPESIDSISAWCFGNCTSLTEISIPDSVTSVCEYAFYGCARMMKITIPAGVTEFGNQAFGFCNNLYFVQNYTNLNLEFDSTDHGGLACYAKIIVDKAGNKIYRDDSSYFDFVDTKDGFRFIKEDGQYKLIGYYGDQDTVVLPEEINGQPYDVYQLHGVKNVIIPEGIQSIHEQAFNYCVGLESIVFPKDITNVQAGAFRGCINLTSVVLSDHVTEIGENAFYGCTKLTSINLPNGLTHIGAGAFANCKMLASIVIPDSVISVGEKAFENTAYYNDLSNWDHGTLCIGNCLIKLSPDCVYDFPQNITTIAYGAFADCYKLQKIDVYGDFSSGLSAITNIETLVIHKLPTHSIVEYFREYFGSVPLTLKNIVLSDTTQMDNEAFQWMTGVTIFVDASEQDVKWNDNFPGWNNGNRVVYGDDWTWATFYDEQGNIISMEPRRNAQIIRKPILEDKEDNYNSYVLVGWDIDGDGIADGVPATTVTDLAARPVYTTIPKEYTVIFKDSETGEIYKQETLHYGDVITAPETPTREDSFLVGWGGYVEGMTVTDNVEFLTNWHVHEMGEWYQTTAPMCTTEGQNRRDCDRCDHFETEVISANGHTEANAVEENRANPTCTESGGYDMAVYCAICGTELSRENMTIPAAGHSHEAVITAPTCTEQGYTTHICHCGDSYVDSEVDALGHTSSDWIVDSEPAIGIAGSKHKECTACGETLETEIIDALTETPTTEAPTTETPTTEALATESESSGGCNGTISASVALLALLSCFAVAWRPCKDN